MEEHDPKGLLISEGIVIPPGELRWRFDTSGGPGGQHANRSATRVELSLDVAASLALTDEQKERVLRHIGRRAASGGVVRVTVDETRSQHRNRELAAERMAALLRRAMERPRRRRRTKPTAGSREVRLQAKARRAQTKRLRRSPPDE
jgi:ribosome-associated protein